MGHIDLLDTISYFEVPEKDARKVMTQLTGIRYHGRTVRCNSEDQKDEARSRPRGAREKPAKGRGSKKPDFTEEGWARRKPKKKGK